MKVTLSKPDRDWLLTAIEAAEEHFSETPVSVDKILEALERANIIQGITVTVEITAQLSLE